jgi:hypothetical protein
MGFGNAGRSEGPEDPGGETIRLPFVGGNSRKSRARGKENGFGNSHFFLMLDQLLIGSGMKIDVLMDINDFLIDFRVRHPGCRSSDP